jgi:hypothetical protein
MWWATGNSWIEWCTDEMPHWIGKYISEVTIDISKILIIDNIEKFELFEKKYTHTNVHSGLSGLFYPNIDWPAVTKKYSGIEISPYRWEKRLNSFWYYGYDIASGCIWNKDALLKRKLLYAYSEKSSSYEVLSGKVRG